MPSRPAVVRMVAAALSFEARWSRTPPGSDFEAWVRECAEDRARMIGKPLDFAALASSSALQRAVVALHDEARRWPGGAEQQVESGMDYELTRMIAEETISRHGVPPDRVNGIVFVLDVVGVWWQPVEPGVVVYSVASRQDPGTTADLLRDVFETGLAV